MRAYKCDICGRLYESHKDTLFGKKQMGTDRIIVRFGLTNDNYKNIADMEICPDCSSAIFEKMEELSGGKVVLGKEKVND